MPEKVRHIRPRKLRRVHGLQLPLHPQQVLAWLIMTAFVLVTYGAIVPALHSTMHLPVAILSGFLFTSHIITHFLTLGLDPADPELRTRKSRSQIPEFDRNIHSHVIENGRCHLCNITTTSSKTKHCSSCNKCVDVFDHHCKWLNHCIGKRNYKIFIACVTTAILSCLMIMGLCLAEIVLYYFSREQLSPFEDSSTINSDISVSSHEDDKGTEDNSIMCEPSSPYCHFVVFGARIYDGAFIGLLSAVFSVSLVAEVLLIHLASFHAYIYCLGLTTYEFIRENNAREHGSSVSYGNYSKEDRPDPEGAICGGWTAVRSASSNQITPSSTLNTTLQSTSSNESFLSSVASRSPRVSPGSGTSPSTPIEGANISFLQRGSQSNIFKFHKDASISNDKSPTFVTNSVSRSNHSTVPSLPFISKSVSSRSRNALRSLSRSRSSGEPLNDTDVEVKLVAIPRPKPSRRRLGSSVAPHLSPIKECDQAASSPPSLRGVRAEKNGEASSSRSNSKGNSPIRSFQKNSPSRVSPILCGPPIDSQKMPSDTFWASPSHPASVNTQANSASGSLLKKTIGESSINKHIYSNPQTKVYVVNDHSVNNPCRRRDNGNLNTSNSRSSSFSSSDDSPNLSHIKGKKVAISLANGRFEGSTHSSIVENGFSDREKRKNTDQNILGSDYSTCSRNSDGSYPMNRTKSTSKIVSATRTGPHHVELHM